MKPLAEQVQPGVVGNQLTFEPQGDTSVGEFGAETAVNEPIGPGGLAMVFAGSALGQEQVQQMHVPGARRSVVVVDPPGTAANRKAVLDLQRVGATGVVLESKPASEAWGGGFHVKFLLRHRG